MPLPKKLLNPNEEIVLDLHPHWFFFAAPLLSALGFLVVYLIVIGSMGDSGLETTLQWILGLGILGSLGWALWRYLNWSNTNFVVTTDRVMYRHGLFAKSGVNIPLDRINNVIFHQNFIERMFDSGDLVVESAGEFGRSRFENVQKPDEVQNVIYQEMDAHQTRSYERMADVAQSRSAPQSNLPPPGPATAAAASSPDVVEALERLEGLRDRGSITAEEYEAQKAKLLGA